MALAPLSNLRAQIQAPQYVRVVGYVHDPARISLEDRIDNLALNGACANLVVLETFDDSEAIGWNAERPGLDRAIGYVASRRATGVLVEDIGRLARGSGVVPELCRRLDALGASLWDYRFGRITPAKLELASQVGVKRLRNSRMKTDGVIHRGWPRRVTH